MQADARINLEIGASAKNVEVYACDETGRKIEANHFEQKKGKRAFSTLTDKPVYHYDIAIESRSKTVGHSLRYKQSSHFALASYGLAEKP